MKKGLLFSALLCAGLTAFAQTDSKVDVTVGNWVFAAERFDKGVSISEITTTGSGAVDFTTATFSNENGENKIFNIRPRVFRGCTALTSVKFPASLESFMPMAADEFFSTDLDGDGTNKYRTLDKTFGNADFELTATVTFSNWENTEDKAAFFPNQWGCAVLATGTESVGTGDSFPGGFQIYLNSPTNNSGQLLIKLGSTSHVINNTAGLINECGGTILIKMLYKNDAHTLTISVSNANDVIATETLQNVTIGTVSALSTNINSGVHMVAAVTEPSDVSTAEIENPFRGCVNLTDFEVEEGNTIFSVGPNGALRKNGEVKAYPYGRLFDKLLRFNVTDANGAGTGVYLTSGVHAKADGTPNSGAEDGTRQFIYTEGKTGASLFEFKYFPDDATRAISILDINASYDGIQMWGGGKANGHNRWEATGNHAWSGENIGMAVVPGRELVTFNITIGNYYITIADNKAVLTADKSQATEFAIEFAEYIEVPLANGYATACLPVGVTAPEVDGLHVCDATVVNNEVVLKTLGNTIAARKPVILYSENGAEKVTLKIDETAAAADEVADAASVLKGFSCICTVLTAADSYGYDGTAANFGQTTSTAANSAILVKPADATWAETLTIDASETTGIKEVESTAAAKSAAIYDLHGRRVSNASKGIFIINGVKTLVK